MPLPASIEPLIDQAFDLIVTRPSTEGLIFVLRDLLGVGHATYTTASSNLDPTMRPVVRTTYSAEWLKRYIEMSYENVDPVLGRGYASALPFKWSEIEIQEPEVVAMMRDASRHGIGSNGLSIPVVTKTGRRGLFSVTCSDLTISWDRFCADNLVSLTRIADRLHSKILSESFEEPALQLSRREIECLTWCSQGKEAKDMAVILGLSVHTVRDYLKSARFKLNCYNLPQAVAKAIACGLISTS